MGNINELFKLMCTYCLYNFMDDQFCIVLLISIVYDYFYTFLNNIIFEYGENWLTNIPPLETLVVFLFQRFSISSK